MQDAPIQSAMFSFRVSEFLSDDDCVVPPILSKDSTCFEIVQNMRDNKSDCVLIMDDNRICGIITESDVTQRLAFLASEDTKASGIMSQPVICVDEDDYLYTAIASMQRANLRHLPVVNTEGAPVAVLKIDKAMQMGAPHFFRRMQWALPEGDDIDALQEIKRKQSDLAFELLQEYVPVPHIQVVISQLNREINRSVIDIALSEMVSPPPVGFAVLMMGSGGREENFLHPDQDNGIILDDYPDDQHDEIDSWFRQFSEKLNFYLDKVGYIYCPGYVMAENPMWRKTISQWKEQTEIWISRNLPFAISYADIFFDFTHLYGERDLVAELRTHVTSLLPRYPDFVQMLFQDASMKTHLPLGWFDRIKLISKFKDEENAGTINMKHTVIMPAVQCLRHLSMKYQITETSSLKRLEALEKLGFFNRIESADIEDAFDIATNILLAHQIQQYHQGVAMTNYVKYKSLTKRQKSDLKQALKAIKNMRQKAIMEFTGKVL